MLSAELDQTIMLRALDVARRGSGYVSPNPLVGCVITDADGVMLGEGAHLVYGGPHAEPNAISDAESRGHSVRGATAYVTLEPHAHFGTNPPCSKLLIEKGIARCVIAMEDPNPKVHGAGIKELEDAGIKVEVGLLEAEARELNRFFIKHITTGLPYVTLKLASTLDGRSALANGESKWITSEASRAIVHAMRAEHDAVMIGARTAMIDDPELTPRLSGGRVPRRIVLDARLELPTTLKLFTDEHRSKTMIVTTIAAEESKKIFFYEAGIELLIVEETSGRIDLANMLSILGQRNIASILVEAGSTLAASIIRDGLFDELSLFIAPMMLGSDARPSVGLLGLDAIKNAPRLLLKDVAPVEGSDDIWIRYMVEQE